MQNISLQVLEPPTNKCTCRINCMGHSSNLTCELTIADCGRPQITAVWKRNETFEVLGKGNYLVINSSFHDNELLCCPAGPALRCVDDPQQFCTPVSIPHRDDESPYKSGSSTLQTDPVTTRATHHGDTEYSNLHNVQTFVLPVSSLTVASLAAIFSLFIFIMTCRITKINRHLVEIIQMKQLEESWEKVRLINRIRLEELYSKVRENKKDTNDEQNPSARFLNRNNLLPESFYLQEDI